MMKNIKKILPYIKSYKKEVSLYVVFNSISIALSLFTLGMMMPFIGILFGKVNVTGTVNSFKWNINSILDHLYIYLQQYIKDNGTWHTLFVVCSLMLLLTFVRVFFSYMSMYFLAPVRNGVVRDLRNKLFNRVLGLHMGYFYKKNKGDIISRLTADVQEVETSIVRSLQSFVRNPLLIIFTLATLFFISINLSLIVIVALPIVSYIVQALGKKIKSSSKAGQKSYGRLVSIIEETIFGMRIIALFNSQNQQETLFKTQNQHYTHLMNKVWRRKGIAGPLSELIITIVMIVVLLYGGFIIFNNGTNTLKPEVFLGFIVMFMRLTTPTRMLMVAYYDIQKGLAAIDRINELLAVRAKIKNIEGARKITQFKSHITINNVGFKYENTQILKNISITIPKGKTIAIVGASGSGKSTIADLISRHYDPTEGEILFDDINSRHICLHSLRNMIGYVTQEPILFNDTVANNILMGRKTVSAEDIHKAASIANAHSFIINLDNGYNTIVGDRGMNLSGGERQRISIARAILTNPPIIVMDEATSSLDSESEKHVMEAIKRIMENRTTLIIAHRFSTILHADQIIVLSKGEIEARGTHSELIKSNEYYKRFFAMQQDTLH